MAEYENPFQLGQMIGEFAGLILEPYAVFLDKLHSEGRVTDSEMAELRDAREKKISHLGKLLESSLKKPST